MPAVDTSFYTNMARGKRYWTFISEELPSLVCALFPISDARKDTFVAGLSMGGYGAMKLGMTYPDRYAAAASLSGALDISQVVKAPGREWQNEMRRIFGDPKKVEGSPNDLFALASSLAASKWKKNPCYICCGTDDFLIDANRRFRDHAKALGLSLTYEEEPGVHEWGYWDNKIQRVLEWLPIKKSNLDIKS
jgi:S-formylglutathione hydrolase FrmB